MALGNNFIPSFLTTIGAIIAFHREYILQVQDEFPIFLCYSAQSGTGTLLLYSILMLTALIGCIIVLGKSTSLRNALSLFGGEEKHILGPDTPPAAVVYRAAHTTIPLGLS